MSSRDQRTEDLLAAAVEDTSHGSAAVVAPLLLRLTDAESVLDVGCGTGAWLKAMSRCGVSDRLGLDVMNEGLVSGGHVESVDLEKGFSVGRRYDLALCLEVAEHLEAGAASELVRSLTRAAPVVAFSAAIPGQGGIHHVNEQWPSYWQEMFGELGYSRHDVIRPSIWFDDRVAWWYRQNLFLFAEPGWSPSVSLPHREIRDWIVHPEQFASVSSHRPEDYSLSLLLRALPSAARTALRHRVPGRRDTSSR